MFYLWVFCFFRKRELTNRLRVCVFARYLSIKVYDDKEKERKMSINNRFVRMGKEKVAEVDA